MSLTSITSFQNTLQVTHEWLNELNGQLGRDDSQQAYRILRAVLMALRDRLTVEEATDFGAQLPMLVRGFYYEGWNPSKNPSGERNRETFLKRVAENLAPVDGDPEQITRAVFRVVQNRVTAGEVKDIRSNLPTDVKSLWPHDGQSTE